MNCCEGLTLRSGNERAVARAPSKIDMMARTMARCFIVGAKRTIVGPFHRGERKRPAKVSLECGKSATSVARACVITKRSIRLMNLKRMLVLGAIVLIGFGSPAAYAGFRHHHRHTSVSIGFGFSSFPYWGYGYYPSSYYGYGYYPYGYGYGYYPYGYNYGYSSYPYSYGYST